MEATPTWYLVLQTMANAAIAGTFVIYWRQLKAMRGQLEASRQAATAESILQLVNFLQAFHIRDAREIVITRLSHVPFLEWGLL